MNSKWKLIAGGLAILAAFLLGFVPEFLQKRRVQNDLETTQTRLVAAQQQKAIDEIRMMAGRILLEASRKNYGLARDDSTALFNKVRELAEKTDNTSLKSSLLVLANWRDSITSGLAQGDALVIPELQLLLEHTYDLPNIDGGTR